MGVPPTEWFYCLTCARAWPARMWRDLEWSCPSDADHPEVHPHVRWSRVEALLGVSEPETGRLYELPVPRNRALVRSA